MSIAVVGSMNHDLVVRVPEHPRPGETVLGRGHTTGPGGKGANQAVAAARLGADVSFFGRVGNDVQGRTMRDAMSGLGIDVSGLGVDDEAATGLAVVVLDDGGENSIVVSPGANARFAPHHLDEAVLVLDRAEVTLLQLEIPIETVMRAATLAGHRLLLNPAPARTLPPELLGLVDVLVPNQTELGLLAGVPVPRTVEESAIAAETIDGPGAVVVTMGEAGALVVARGLSEHIAAPAVESVDTTGAGDTFCGALAASLAGGSPLMDAAVQAVCAGALATTKVGAQSAMPSVSEVVACVAAR